jgi:SAM-dependent methyltransferase
MIDTLIRKFDMARHQIYDVMHHVDTRRFVSIMDMEDSNANILEGRPYMATPPHTSETLFRWINWDTKGTTFIDIGCGKGSVLLTAAADRRFKRIIGVEYSAALSQIAKNNIEQYRGRLQTHKIDVITGDAAEFQFPDGPLMVYFFNPFRDVTMDAVLKNLNRRLRTYAPSRVVCHSWHTLSLIENDLSVIDVQHIPYFDVYQVASLH